MKRLLLIVSIIAVLFTVCVNSYAQTYNNGEVTTPVTFPGVGCTYNWTNDNPGIGLPASGTGNIPSFTAVNNGNSSVTAHITATPVASVFAYIGNQNNTISVINVLTNTLVGTFNLTGAYTGVAISPDGSRLYGTSYGDHVSVINTLTNTLITNIQVGGLAYCVAISPDGKRVYCTNAGSQTVSVIDTESNTVIATISVGYDPFGIAVSPDGSTVYVANNLDGTISIIDTTTNTVVSTLYINSGTFEICFSPDGSKAYVTSLFGLTVINTETRAIISTTVTGYDPWGVAVSPDGSKIYVANGGDNSVSVIDGSTNQVVATLSPFPGVANVSFSLDGSEVYVTNSFDSSVSVINTSTNKVVTTIKVGTGPTSLGNFISKGPGCKGSPINFAITVNSSPPIITTTPTTGTITACAGTPSASPNIQQITVSGSNLTTNIIATAPPNFEVSLSSGSGYGSSVSIPQSGGAINNTTVYVRSAASSAAGNISGNVSLASTGAATQTVPVTGTVNALPTVNQPTSPVYTNGDVTTPINFTGTAENYNWTNNAPGIGLPASGSGSIPSFNAVNTGAGAVTATITVTPTYGALAYIANEGDKTVSVINTSNNMVIKTVNVGTNPSETCPTPDGSSVYVTNTYDGTVSVINTASNTVIKTIKVGSAPEGETVSPDGSKIYVANQGTNDITVISTATNTVTATITAGLSPYGVVVSPDNKFIYVSNSGSNDIWVFNAITRALITKIKVGIEPTNVAISKDGTLIYVPNYNDNNISVINTATNTIIATINTGINPNAITFSKDGSLFYVTNSGSASVWSFNTQTNAHVSTINAGSYPDGISISPDGSRMYVVNDHLNTVTVVNTANNTIVTAVSVGPYPISFGNFITAGTNCPGPPVQFTITVNAAPPNITASTAIGKITACIGSASSSPNIQQFTVSGSNLTDNINATAPANFEVSLTPGSGYGNIVTIPQSGGKVNSTKVYVRSAASATGSISGNVTLISTGAPPSSVSVTGIVNQLPEADQPGNQTYVNGQITTPLNFTGTANTFTWVNDNPGIGLPASGITNIPIFTAVNTGSSPVIAHITVTPISANYLYITNLNTNDVSVVNTFTNSIVAKIPVGINPQGVAVSPDGSRVYITNSNSGPGNTNGTVSVISTANNKVLTTIPVKVDPYGVVVSPDNKLVYVVDALSNNISVISASNNSVTANIPTGDQPTGAAVSPDGKLLYVTTQYINGGNLLVINTTTNTITSTIPVGLKPIGVATSPDGSIIYVANGDSNNLEVINAATQATIAVIATGTFPTAVVVSPDGTRVYVSNNASKDISIIDATTNKLITTIADGGNILQGASISPDGKYLYVVNSNSNNVSVIDTKTNTLSNLIDVGANSTPISFGNFILPGSGCDGMPVHFTITVAPTPPTAITATGTLPSLNTTYGTPSSSASFVVSGTSLTQGILVTPPPGFEVSTDNTTFSSTVTVGTSGTLISTTVYIRLAATTHVGTYSGNVVLSTAGATSVTVATSASKVNDASLTITADNQTKPYNTANPILTVTYSGFVNGEGPGQFTALPTITTTATLTSLPGDYTIIADGASSPDYTFKYINGVLTVLSPSPQSIVIPNTFTPNGDRINDVWDINELIYFPQCTVLIYTRYGNLVYQSKGYTKPWDGTSGGKPLPVGTYYYIITLQPGTKPIAGPITIIR